MILGSVKIHTKLASLNPQHVTIQIGSVSTIWQTRDPRAFRSKIWTCDVKITKQDKADPNQSKLGKRVLHEFKHKVKPKATQGNLMNLLDLAKIQ
jgi:hypothetical protein